MLKFDPYILMALLAALSLLAAASAWSVSSGCGHNEFYAQCYDPPRMGAIQPSCYRVQPSCQFPKGRAIEPAPGCYCQPACLCSPGFLREFDADLGDGSKCVPKCMCEGNAKIQLDCDLEKGKEARDKAKEYADDEEYY